MAVNSLLHSHANLFRTSPLPKKAQMASEALLGFVGRQGSKVWGMCCDAPYSALPDTTLALQAVIRCFGRRRLKVRGSLSKSNFLPARPKAWIRTQNAKSQTLCCLQRRLKRYKDGRSEGESACHACCATFCSMLCFLLEHPNGGFLPCPLLRVSGELCTSLEVRGCDFDA